jgi:hypothetical protein
MLPPKMILCPVDFSTHSDEALKVATDLAVQFGAALCLVHVVPAIPKISTLVEFFHEGEYEKELHKNAAERLGQIADDIARKGVTVTSQVGTANEAGMEIQSRGFDRDLHTWNDGLAPAGAGIGDGESREARGVPCFRFARATRSSGERIFRASRFRCGVALRPRSAVKGWI